MEGSLQGKVAVVIGGTSGINVATAQLASGAAAYVSGHDLVADSGIIGGGRTVFS